MNAIYKQFLLALCLATTTFAASNTPLGEELSPAAPTTLSPVASSVAEDAPHPPITTLAVWRPLPTDQIRAKVLATQPYQHGQTIHLLDLPNELLLRIFSFLGTSDSDFDVLWKVSKKMRDIHHQILFVLPRSVSTYRSFEGYPWNPAAITHLSLNPARLSRNTVTANPINDAKLQSWLVQPLCRLESLEIQYTHWPRAVRNYIQPETMRCSVLLPREVHHYIQPETMQCLVDTLVKPHSSPLRKLKLKQSLTSGSLIVLAKALKSKQGLQSLILEDNPPRQDIEAFTQALGALTTAILDNADSKITELGLPNIYAAKNEDDSSFGGVQDEQVFLPLVQLVQLNRLTSLNLFGCQLGLQKARTLLEALEQNTSITSLNLGGNNLGLAGGTFVAHMLKHNHTLVSLSVASNKLESSGSTEIMKVFINGEYTPTRNTTLRDLNISHNGVINDAGTIYAICELVRTNSTLRSLDLMNSHPGAINISKILWELKKNPHTGLQSLNLKGNTSADDIVYLKGLLPDALKEVVLL